MAFKIYLDQTVIRVDDSDGNLDPQVFNPAQTRYYIFNNDFVLLDNVTGYRLNVGEFTEVTKADDTVPTSKLDLVTYLNSFVNFRTGGSGRSINPDHLFADAAARDTYFSTNQQELRQAQTEIILLDTSEIQLWLGETNPATYSAANNWLTEGTLPTALQIKTLYESNSNTNAFTDAFNTILGLFTNTTDELQLSKDFYAPSIRTDTGSMFLDQAIKISSNSQGIDIRDEIRGQRAELIQSDFDPTSGSSVPKYNQLAALDTFDVHLVDDEQSASFETIFPTINAIKWERFIVKPRAAGDGVFMVRYTDGSGKLLISMFTVTFEAGDVGQETEFMLLSALNLNVGEFIHVTYTGVNLAGHQYSADPTWGDQFVMFAKTMSYPRTPKDLALAEDLDNVLHTDEAGEIAAVTEKTTPADADVILIEDSEDSNNKKRVQVGNLPGNGSGTDDDAIHDNVAGEIAAITEKTTPVATDLIVIEDSADSNNKKRVQVGNLPGGSGTDDDAIHDNVAGEIAAVTAKASPVGADVVLIEDSEDSNNKKRVTLAAIVALAGGSTPTPTGHDLRHGLSAQSDPALVDFASLIDVADPTDPQTVSTGTTTAGQYFHIFSANTHDIQTIRDTVLDQIVYQDGGTGNIFTKTNDVRTEASITYDAYTIGPLNAGVDEEYVLAFS